MINTPRYKPNECPVCGSKDLKWTDSDIHDECVCYSYECNGCHFEGKEWHTMKFYCHSDITGKRIFTETKGEVDAPLGEKENERNN